MSKAFTREDDAGDEPVAFARESNLPPGATNYVTPGGARRLRDELARLVDVERPAAARDAAPGAAPDAEAASARRRLQEIDHRIRALNESLASAEVVDPAAQDKTRVLFGATVTVRDGDDRELSYRVVGVDEADPKAGRVSWVSPIARALLGARVGDVVTFRSPRGEEEYEVVAIAYETDEP